jgi:hypothetical protein
MVPEKRSVSNYFVSSIPPERRHSLSPTAKAIQTDSNVGLPDCRHKLKNFRKCFDINGGIHMMAQIPRALAANPAKLTETDFSEFICIRGEGVSRQRRGTHQPIMNRRKLQTTLAEPLQQIDRTYVQWRGKKLTYFGGCDYFRLASHPEIIRAVQEGLQQFGLNVAASRFTTGNHELYGRLERKLCRFFRTESATLLSNGYATNIVAAQALAGEFSHALIDSRAHQSLRDCTQFL